MYLGAKYIQGGNAKLAFVSTNSIYQGEYASLLWPHSFDKGLEIGFSHQSFKWSNNAKESAGVICVVVGIRNMSSDPKWLFSNGVKRSVLLINAYLFTRGNVVVFKRNRPVANLPPMTLGNMPQDDGNLILSTEQKNFLLKDYPSSRLIIRKLIGANELMKGLVRWCLWITDSDLSDALQIPRVRNRVEKVRQFRLSSTDQSANKMAQTSHKFREQHVAQNIAIIVPTVTSERRDYIPMGYLDKQTVIVAPNNAIYDFEPWVFGAISSRMHMTWVRAIAGRLKTDYRYLSALCYNTFPISELTEEQKQTITMHVMNVLEEREKHPEKTMAQLYDPDKMPDGLRDAHQQLDLAVDRLYRTKPFVSDEERLEHLFKLYAEMTANERSGS